MKPTYIKELNAEVIVEIIKKEDEKPQEGFRVSTRGEQYLILDSYHKISRLTNLWWYKKDGLLYASRLDCFDDDSRFIAGGRDVDDSNVALRGVIYIKLRVGK